MDPSVDGAPSSESLLLATTEIQVTADFFGGGVTPRALRGVKVPYRVLLPDPLILEPEPERFAVLTRFGGLVCWNCPDELRRRLWQAIAALPGTHERRERVEDCLDVQIGATDDAVEFDRLFLRELTLENLMVVSLALARSAALEHAEILVGEALTRTEPLVSGLRETGRLRSKEREVIRSVGFALHVRADVLSNLTLSDEPPEVWEDEDLAHLDAKLYDHFELEERSVAINQKIDYLQELNNTLLSLLANRKGHRLEWIIIILIAIEILFFVFTEVRESLPTF